MDAATGSEFAGSGANTLRDHFNGNSYDVQGHDTACDLDKTLDQRFVARAHGVVHDFEHDRNSHSAAATAPRI
jgi:hypothetical protein